MKPEYTIAGIGTAIFIIAGWVSSWTFAAIIIILMILCGGIIFFILNLRDKKIKIKLENEYKKDKDKSRPSDKFRSGSFERGKPSVEIEPDMQGSRAGECDTDSRNRESEIRHRESEDRNKPNRFTPI